MTMYKIFGKLFGMARTDFMSPIVANDLDQGNLKGMFDSLAGKLFLTRIQSQFFRGTRPT